MNISQTRTEEILDERIAAEPLIEVRWDHQVTGIAQDQQGVTLALQQGERLDRVVETARDIASREAAQAERLLKGELLRTQFDLDRYVARRHADPNYTFREHLKSFGGAIEI